jgi:hypothetical protein
MIYLTQKLEKKKLIIKDLIWQVHAGHYDIHCM